MLVLTEGPVARGFRFTKLPGGGYGLSMSDQPFSPTPGPGQHGGGGGSAVAHRARAGVVAGRGPAAAQLTPHRVCPVRMGAFSKSGLRTGRAICQFFATMLAMTTNLPDRRPGPPKPPHKPPIANSRDSFVGRWRITPVPLGWRG
jgi:hypothetical protein